MDYTNIINYTENNYILMVLYRSLELIKTNINDFEFKYIYCSESFETYTTIIKYSDIINKSDLPPYISKLLLSEVNIYIESLKNNYNIVCDDSKCIISVNIPIGYTSFSISVSFNKSCLSSDPTINIIHEKIIKYIKNQNLKISELEARILKLEQKDLNNFENNNQPEKVKENTEVEIHGDVHFNSPICIPDGVKELSRENNNISEELRVKFYDIIPFRILIDVVKNVQDSVVLEFMEYPEKKDANHVDCNNNEEKKNDLGEIRITGMDPSKSLFFFIKLAKFAKFKVSNPIYNVGLNLTHLFELIKPLDKNDILTMSIDSNDKQKLIIETGNEINDRCFSIGLNILDIDINTYDFPPTKFDMVVTMDSSEFHRICKDLAYLSEYVEITCKETGITFKSVCDYADKNYTLSSSNKGIVKIQTIASGKDIIVQDIFELKYFKVFEKCQYLCRNIQIFFKNNFPVFIKYLVPFFGQILFSIVPVNAKNMSKIFSYNVDGGNDKDIQENPQEPSN